MDFGEKCQETINKGICQGNCCGNTPLPSELVEKNRDKFQVEVIKELKADFNDGENIYCETEDNKCVFLNRKTLGGMIYNERPEICRKFGTDKENTIMQCPFLKVNGNPRSPAQQRRYQRQNRDWMKQRMKAIEKQLDYDEFTK